MPWKKQGEFRQTTSKSGWNLAITLELNSSSDWMIPSFTLRLLQKTLTMNKVNGYSMIKEKITVPKVMRRSDERKGEKLKPEAIYCVQSLIFFLFLLLKIGRRKTSRCYTVTQALLCKFIGRIVHTKTSYLGTQRAVCKFKIITYCYPITAPPKPVTSKFT